jgi:NADH dehydrogenase FAD-containing subunit
MSSQESSHPQQEQLRTPILHSDESRVKRILVIGYGAFGSQLVAALVKKNRRNIYKITVVTPFEYMEVSVKMTKVVAAGPEEHKKALFPLLRENGVEYIIDRCVSLTETEATTESGLVIPFDLCVIGVGQRIPIFLPNPSPVEKTLEQRKQSIIDVYSEIYRANHIVIAGGGAVGTEIAADIKLRNKEKQ